MGDDSAAPTPIPERILAEFNSYQGMLDAMRERAKERQLAITSSEVAAVSGLPDYYIAKLLAVHPVRRIGMISLGPILGVLGVKLLMVEDADAIARFAGKLKKRDERCVNNGAAITIKFSRRRMQILGKKGAQIRWARARKIRAAAVKGGHHSRKNLSREEASEIGRRAVAARWEKAKERIDAG